VDVVLGVVQPDEIALDQVVPAAGKVRTAVSVDLLFREHYARIVGMLARLTGDRAHSEEIASDVFHKLSQRPSLLDSADDLTAWIYRVATNAGFDALRTNSRRRKREEAAGSARIHGR
jgi:RNA polymerase sigma-70 factor (ECF subfamily)